jgi:hypothetical protein
VDDLDLARGTPSIRTQPTLHLANITSVKRIHLASIAEYGRGLEYRLDHQPQGVCDPLDHVE